MLFIFCRAIVNKRSQICIFLFARIGYNFLVMDGTKKPLEENDIIHRTLSLLPLLNSVEIVSSKTVLRFLNQTLKINNFFGHHLMVYFVPSI